MATHKEPRTGVESGLIVALYIASYQDFSLGHFLLPNVYWTSDSLTPERIGKSSHQHHNRIAERG